METLIQAENALRTLYLSVLNEQLNNLHPFFTRVKQTTTEVWGKEIRKIIPFNSIGTNDYMQFSETLKNFYNTIELNEKIIQTASLSTGSFVNLLNAELENLLVVAKFNWGRMLFSDGSGILSTVLKKYDNGSIIVDNIKNFREGMVIDFIHNDESFHSITGNRIIRIDREKKLLYFNSSLLEINEGDKLTLQNSYNKELTGLEAIFKEEGTLYSLNKAQYKELNPYIKKEVGEINDEVIWNVIDYMESINSNIDFIICSSGVKRAYMDYLQEYKRNVDIISLESGYKAISFNGIPIISDRFCEKGTMYFLNTKDFEFHQLCDWTWLEKEFGTILEKVQNKPIYKGTLVKYGDLICNNPYKQGKLINIIE